MRFIWDIRRLHSSDATSNATRGKHRRRSNDQTWSASSTSVKKATLTIVKFFHFLLLHKIIKRKSTNKMAQASNDKMAGTKYFDRELRYCFVWHQSKKTKISFPRRDAAAAVVVPKPDGGDKSIVHHHISKHIGKGLLRGSNPHKLFHLSFGA